MTLTLQDMTDEALHELLRGVHTAVDVLQRDAAKAQRLEIRLKKEIRRRKKARGQENRESGPAATQGGG